MAGFCKTLEIASSCLEGVICHTPIIARRWLPTDTVSIVDQAVVFKSGHVRDVHTFLHKEILAPIHPIELSLACRDVGDQCSDGSFRKYLYRAIEHIGRILDAISDIHTMSVWHLPDCKPGPEPDRSKDRICIDLHSPERSLPCLACEHSLPGKKKDLGVTPRACASNALFRVEPNRKRHCPSHRRHRIDPDPGVTIHSPFIA